MENIYDKLPLKIHIINPYNSKISKRFEIPVNNFKGGLGYHKTMRDVSQKIDFSILDEDIEKLEKFSIKVDECQYQGCPEHVSVYNYTNIRDLRFKIYIATGIHPHRQHLILMNTKGGISLPYSFYLGQDMVEINIFNSVQNLTDQQIYNIPFDLETVNNKQDIKIDMYDNFISLLQGKTHICRILLCDLYDIISPSNDNITDLLNTGTYQKEMIYYGFIIKFFPLLSYDGFEHIYLNKSGISEIYSYLSPDYNILKNKLEREKKIINNLYKNVPKAIKFFKSITKRDIYYLKDIQAEVKIPPLNIRNLFDLFKLTNVYVFSVVKLLVNGRLYIADKKYLSYTEDISISMNKVPIGTFILLLSNGIKINILKNTITISKKYSDSDKIMFDEAYKNIKDIVTKIIEDINILGSTVLIETDYINCNMINMNVTNSNIILNWPENYTSEQFAKFKDYLLELDDVGVLTLLQSSGGTYECSLNRGNSNVSHARIINLLQQFPNIRNQYEYYTSNEFKSRWDDITRKTINIIQKIANTSVILTGFDMIAFESFYYLMLSILYSFSKSLSNKRQKIQVEEKGTKRLKKLRGIDPELYDIKRHDPKYSVYSIKCQSDRQPVIYKNHELKYLSNTIKNRLFKFWNFTEEGPVYYDCPNKIYPYLSFRPQDHPLGFCLPCCKKLVPSEESRQNKIDIACVQKHILPHNEIDEIIKKLDRDTTHLLSYGKEIPVGRFSKIPYILESNIFMEKTKYRLAGVDQHLPLYNEAGFIYSIIYALDISLTKFAKDITKIINNNTMYLLDEGHTLIFKSADHLKEYITNLLLDSKRITLDINIELLDFINVISQLVYIVYGHHIVVITDYDNKLDIRTINSTQICLLSETECSLNSYIVIFAHDDGIYPMTEIPDKRIFNKNDIVIKSISNIIEKEQKKIRNIGTSLSDIFLFIKKNEKKYSISHVLRGKRGLVYAVVINKGRENIFVPCIYSDYLDSRYKSEIDFPIFKNFKRSVLYEYIDDYNAYLIKKDPNKNPTNLIDPYAVIKYKDDYIGFKVRYLNNRFGTTFYHASEKTTGRYHTKVIEYSYNIQDINKAIYKQSTQVINKDVGKYAYNNYIYNLFLIEFGYEVRKHKNTKIRDKLEDLLKSKNQVDRRLIKQALIDYPLDYKTIIELLTINQHSKVLSIIQGTLFTFDMKLLKSLKDLKGQERVTKINKIMESYISFSDKIPDLSNILVSCRTDIELEQCNRNKLIMSKSNFDKCCNILAKDLDIPYIYETISMKINDVRQELNFIKRPTEILHINEFE
uniref:Ig-like domain-containing protein n=1 Tax=viral metagenome TaxID=1070528 RepID=A0A6C0LLN6_9ZZZZ